MRQFMFRCVDADSASGSHFNDGSGYGFGNLRSAGRSANRCGGHGFGQRHAMLEVQSFELGEELDGSGFGGGQWFTE